MSIATQLKDKRMMDMFHFHAGPGLTGAMKSRSVDPGDAAFHVLGIEAASLHLDRDQVNRISQDILSDEEDETYDAMWTIEEDEQAIAVSDLPVLAGICEYVMLSKVLLATY